METNYIKQIVIFLFLVLFSTAIYATDYVLNQMSGTISVPSVAPNQNDKWIINIGTNKKIKVTYNLTNLNGFIRILGVYHSSSIPEIVVYGSESGVRETQIADGKVTIILQAGSTGGGSFTINFASADAFIQTGDAFFGNAHFNGKVGINTTSPTEVLDIKGRLVLAPPGTTSNNSYNGNLVISKPQASAQYINLAPTGLIPWSIGMIYNTNTFGIGTGATIDNQFSPFLNITSTGKVGIGTSSPTQTLDIKGRLAIAPTGTVPNSSYNGNLVISKPQASAQYINLAPTGLPSWSIGMVYNTSTFGIGTGTTTESQFSSPFFNITGSGNVGIGTTTPAYKLDINGTTRIQNSLYQNTDQYLYLGYVSATDTRLKISTNATSGAYMDYSHGLFFRTASLSNVLTLNQSGNIGIGTASPVYKLDINGITRLQNSLLQSAGQFLYLGYVSATDIRLKISTNAASGAYMDYSHTLHVRNNSQSNIMTFLQNGNVGIGMTAPTYKLDINGTARTTGLEVNGNIRAKEVKIETTGWSDFVFAENYELPSLNEVENHIKQHKHLPNIPSEQEVMENGINIGDIQAKLLQKIEELTLYLINQDKAIQELQQTNQELQQEIQLIKANR